VKQPVRPATTRPKSSHGAAKKTETKVKPASIATYAPKINKMPEGLAAKRENKKIEDMLLDEYRKKQEKLAELERKQSSKNTSAHLKLTDKYVLLKFNKQFKSAETSVAGNGSTEEENGQELS
jgi:hypothetical protein